jgi:hypothetical protein
VLNEPFAITLASSTTGFTSDLLLSTLCNDKRAKIFRALVAGGMVGVIGPHLVLQHTCFAKMTHVKAAL